VIVRELLAKLGVQVDGSSFATAQNSLARLHLALGGLRDIVKPVFDGLKDIAEGTADAAREAQNAARMTGLTTQQVQELDYAAKQSGVSAEELQHGLIHLARSAVEAGQGSQEAAAGYYRLGIRATDSSAKVRPMGELLAEVAGAMQRIPDGTQKAAVAMQIFGRAGAQLIPLLDKGPAGIAALSKEADRLGIVMSTGAIAAGARYKATLDRMSSAVQGLKFAIAEKLFPAVSKSTEQFTAWIAAHRRFLSLKIGEAFELITRAAKGLVAAGKDLVTLFEKMWSMGSAAQAVLTVLGGLAVYLISPWTALAGAIALVANSFELFLEGKDSAVGRVIYGLYRAFNALKTELLDFKSDPFAALQKWAGQFATWFADTLIAALATGPGRALQKSIDDPTSLLGRWSNFVDLGISPPPRPDVPAGYSGRTSGPGFTPPTFMQGLSNLFNNSGAAGMVPSWGAGLWNATSPSWASVGSAGGGAGTTNNITINAPSGDPKAIAHEVRKALADHDDAKHSAALGALDKGH